MKRKTSTRFHQTAITRWLIPVLIAVLIIGLIAALVIPFLIPAG